MSYRSEVVGSLLRPDYLKRAFEQSDRGEITPQELTEIQDHAGLEAIALQEDCGIDVMPKPARMDVRPLVPGE